MHTPDIHTKQVAASSPPTGHTDEQGRASADLVTAPPQPALAFCRTGKRPAALDRKGKALAEGAR